jgi:hypothetical protein
MGRGTANKEIKMKELAIVITAFVVAFFVVTGVVGFSGYDSAITYLKDKGFTVLTTSNHPPLRMKGGDTFQFTATKDGKVWNGRVDERWTVDGKLTWALYAAPRVQNDY